MSETEIKVCPDPHCEAVYHFCKKTDTRCLDCHGWIKKINNMKEVNIKVRKTDEIVSLNK